MVCEKNLQELYKSSFFLHFFVVICFRKVVLYLKNIELSNLNMFQFLREKEPKTFFSICVYDSPMDYSNKYVARIFAGSYPTPFVLISDTYEEIEFFKPLGLTKLMRSDGDPISIREVWI